MRPADQSTAEGFLFTDQYQLTMAQLYYCNEIEPLLVDVLQAGKLLYQPPAIEAIRTRRQADLDRLDPGVKRLINPHIYHVSLTQRLWDLKETLIASARAKRP